MAGCWRSGSSGSCRIPPAERVPVELPRLKWIYTEPVTVRQMPLINNSECKYIMGSIERGNEYHRTVGTQVFNELLGYIESAGPVKTFAKALFNRKPPVLHIPNIPRYVTTNDTEIDDIDKYKLVSDYGMIRRLENHVGHVKITIEYTGYSHIAMQVKFVPQVINNPEEEQSVELPVTDDDESIQDRMLRKETSW